MTDSSPKLKKALVRNWGMRRGLINSLDQLKLVERGDAEKMTDVELIQTMFDAIVMLRILLKKAEGK